MKGLIIALKEYFTEETALTTYMEQRQLRKY